MLVHAAAAALAAALLRRWMLLQFGGTFRWFEVL
jgi:hypothetical protein